MSGYLHGAHSVFAIHLHLVWITKYRKQALSYDIQLKCRDILREICRANDVEIIKGHVASDHIHLFVSIPPQVTISRLVQKLKGKSSFKLLHMFESLRRQYWGRHLWARRRFSFLVQRSRTVNSQAHFRECLLRTFPVQALSWPVVYPPHGLPLQVMLRDFRKT